MRVVYSLLLILSLLLSNYTYSNIINKNKKSITFTNKQGFQLRLTPYGSAIVRAQYALPDESFLPDDYYEMVATHNWEGKLKVKKSKKNYIISIVGNKSLRVFVNKKTLVVDYQRYGVSVLKQNKGFYYSQGALRVDFNFDEAEQFTGLGHSYFGRAASINLKGKQHQRNYGADYSEQAPLIVPYYMSSKGYGIFLNSTFENIFNLGENNIYEIGINTARFKGQMDYFYIDGPTLQEVLSNYVSLTGKPRLPQKSIFGLQLSDKGHDHNSASPSNEYWWKNYIETHKAMRFPLDHVVNDNRWRAGGGKRCESRIEWDAERYPDPSEFKKWLDQEGLTLTIDFNRCIGQYSEGWKPTFNIPVTDNINFKNSAPDLTNSEFRQWFWNILYSKLLAPSLKYPGDGLWIDEFDEMGKAPKDMILSNGRSSLEMRNYWFYLIAKALVKEGWDQQIGEAKRPYVWVRGMTAGAQRYATLWSGDIKPNYEEMKLQIRGMQLAGLSGFPYWGHDAGGFYDWTNQTGPNEAMYQKWSMGMGVFSPIWKPHGMGQSRWPMDRSKKSQRIAKKYADLRYQLMPYTYTIAYEAHQKGVPMVRAMVLDYGQNPKAWQQDLQYTWGKDLLIAPMCTKENIVDLWLPTGGWYDYWNETFYDSETEISYQTAVDEYPIFVKSGAIIPTTRPVASVANLVEEELIIHVYTGANGAFVMYEDDGVTEKFRTKNEYRLTKMNYDDTQRKLIISAAEGSFEKAHTERSFTFVFHGIGTQSSVFVNDVHSDNTSFYKTKNTQTVYLGTFAIDEQVVVELK